MRTSLELTERAVLTAGILALFSGGYFGVGHSVDASEARELATTFDAAIPFVPWTIYVYLGVFPTAFAPLFIVRSRRLFRRLAAAYATVIVISLFLFAVLPVTSAELRPDLSALALSGFTGWCVRLIYSLDPPVNLFPSLHLSIASLSAAGLWRARRAYGAVAFPVVAAIAVSICTVKQHFVIDGVAGIILALAIYTAALRGFESRNDEEPIVYSWQGPLLYLLFLGLVYAGLFTVYRSSLAV